MAEMTVNGKEVLQNLTISVCMPYAFGFRMRLTTAILALARKVSPVELEAEVIEGAKQLRLPGDLKRLDLKPGDRFVLSVDRPISMEMCERIQKLWRDFIGDDSEHRLMVLDAGIELSVINVEAKSEISIHGSEPIQRPLLRELRAFPSVALGASCDDRPRRQRV
ncbi:hypothetical protein GOL21_28160 [Sinorhizobium medicae]|nr:hypothetical protein [Sinorhizobium medicae]